MGNFILFNDIEHDNSSGNNNENQDVFKENMSKITKQQTRQVYRLLHNGIQLSQKKGFEFGIGDTIKRISELRAVGIEIEDRWTTTQSGKRYKIYFIDKTQNLKKNETKEK